MFSIICRLIPRHLENLLVHVLLQLLQYRASLGTTTVDFTLFTRSFTCRVRTGGSGGSGSRAPLSFHLLHALHVEVVDIMSSAVISLWVCNFLGVLQALLMIVFSSIIVILCTSLVCNITRPAYIVNLLFTIAISAERCQSTRRPNIGSVFLFEYSATARHIGVSNSTVRYSPRRARCSR